MNNTLKKMGWILASCIILITGCKTAQKQSTPRSSITTVDTIEIASKYHESVQSMSAQFKMQLLGNQLFSLSGTIQSVTDKELLVSVQALFGIEVLRIYCTPTHATLIDRLGRRTCSMPFSQLEPELGTDFYGLQGLLTNRLFDPDQNNYKNFTYDNVNGDWILTHNGKYQTEFLLAQGTYLQRSIIRSFSKGDYLMATYTNLQEKDGIQYPMQAQYVYYSKDRSNSVDVTFQNITFNQASTINFSIPAGYSTVTVEELKKQLLVL